jgi:hypothetical protein
MRLCFAVIIPLLVIAAGCRAQPIELKGNVVIRAFYEGNLESSGMNVKVFLPEVVSADEKAALIARRIFESTMGDFPYRINHQRTTPSGKCYFEFTYTRPGSHRERTYILNMNLANRTAEYSAER